jgi:hypothetical protein
MLIKFSPLFARLLIFQREARAFRDEEKLEKLEEAIKRGQWDTIPPAWITPNFLINDLVDRVFVGNLPGPSIKPFVIYNGHHRFNKALEHELPFRAYIRYTPGNPPMPYGEKLVEATWI